MLLWLSLGTHENWGWEMGDQIHPANRAAISALVISALALQGCATTPNATVGYYLPKVDVDVKVTETVGCTKDGVIIANLTATSDTKYSADHAKGGYQTIAIRRLDGPLSDTTVGFDYYDDGRLKGFNSTSTGRGEEIIKSAIALARKFTGFTEASLIKINPCDKIATWGGDAKAITLVFVGSIPFDKAGGDRKPLDPDLASQAYLKELGGASHHGNNRASIFVINSCTSRDHPSVTP